ncbi:TAXI family TRAP transporter solute-binding subunit [Roseinatronobacter alkalisoli]|uniref:TAXI family TRAP transporter solute-binding subunit n=1 Tax=Roseinatronobacter alkalisoli TaxID=3028235 RepID=A0ABT5T7V4_9RHOB|nr:TAXI family TRAP transporter solute-binding subunit [Roseinatronobacter sp. HJB301]MDD7971197.1 TAXI family TRAP transporter solute-binding subunit [Roseinatronobacter sp. HJB301]
MTYRFAALAAATALLTAPVQAQELSIATGGTGGVYFPYGGGLAEVINRHVEGASASAEVTGASVENVALISRFDSDLALALADTVYQAFHGEGAFEGRQVDELRAIASIYPNAVQLVTLADSGITSLEDLRGKRVSVGAPGSGTEVSAQTLLAANGITYDDINAQRLNFNETADALRDGDIDAGFWSVGPPTSSIMNLATTRSISMVALSTEEIAAAIAAEPTFAPYSLRAGLYDGMEEPVLTISTPNVLIVHADMDDELAYNITKAMYENVDELIAIHPAANDTTVEFSVDSTPIPFHPGTLRYLEEAGATPQDHQRP